MIGQDWVRGGSRTDGRLRVALLSTSQIARGGKIGNNSAGRGAFATKTQWQGTWGMIEDMRWIDGSVDQGTRTKLFTFYYF